MTQLLRPVSTNFGYNFVRILSGSVYKGFTSMIIYLEMGGGLGLPLSLSGGGGAGGVII